MSIAQHEQRIRTLEAAVIDLKSRVSDPDGDRNGRSRDDVIFDIEHPLLPGIPPKESMRVPATLSLVQRGRQNVMSSPRVLE